MSGEFGTGKTIFVLAIVVGCFAVLWPKIFYPMLTASVKSPASARQAVGWKNLATNEFLQQLCYLLEEHSGARWSHEAECWLFLESSCHLELNESMLEDFRLAKDKTSLTDCLSLNYGLSPNIVAAAVPPKVRPKSYTPQVPWSYVQGDLKSVSLDADVIKKAWADLKTPPHKEGASIIKPGGAHHVRPERPAHLYPEMMHPALREKGRAMPQRTIDKNPRPGPMPGMRPTMGGAGGIVPPPQGKGSGAMGIIMPLYTVGIVVFFVYTIMKVLFKKGSDDDKAPKLKDFGMDPEYRKYVFAEEYLDNQNVSTKSELRRQQREDSRQRRRMHEVPDTKIEDEQMDHLRRRLEDTEVAMERLMNQMGSVTDKLTAAKITEVLSQAQAQAKILKIGLDSVMESAAAVEDIYKAKDEAGDLSLASEDDLTTSEALTTTMSDESSFPSALHRHLQDLQNEENSISSKGSSPDMEEYEVINKEVDQKSCKKPSKESSPAPITESSPMPTTKSGEECPKSTSAPNETGELKKETENKSTESAPTTITSTKGEPNDVTTPTITSTEGEPNDMTTPTITSTEGEPNDMTTPTITSTEGKPNDMPTPTITSTEGEPNDMPTPTITSTEGEPNDMTTPKIKSTEGEPNDMITPTITSTEDETKDMTTSSENEDNAILTIKTDESLSSNHTDTKYTADTDKVENVISDRVSTDQSKKENLISEKLPTDDVSSSKLVRDEEENSIEKVEE